MRLMQISSAHSRKEKQKGRACFPKTERQRIPPRPEHTHTKKKKNIPAFLTPRGEEANPHTVHYKLYISLVLFSVMAATPDTGEQFRIKLPGVDSSGV